MAISSLSAAALSNVNPYTPPAGWSYRASQFKVASNSFRAIDASPAILVTSNPNTSGDLEVNFTVFKDNNAPLGRVGAAFVDSAGDGYIVHLYSDTAEIFAVAAGAKSGGNLSFSYSLSYSAGDAFRATYVRSTNTLNLYQNSVSTTVPINTATGLTFLTGMAGGICQYAGEDNQGVISFDTTIAAASTSLDTLSSPVNVGGTGYTGTTTGLGAATSLTFAGKTATITGTGSGTFTFSMPTFVHGVTYPAMGGQTFTVGDGTLTATKTATVNSLSGYTPVTMVTLDRGEFSIGKDTNIITGDVVHLPTAGGTLNADGTLTDYVFGSYTMWRRDVSDGKMYSSTLTVSESGVGGGTTGLTSSKITLSGITSSGLTS